MAGQREPGFRTSRASGTISRDTYYCIRPRRILFAVTRTDMPAEKFPTSSGLGFEACDERDGKRSRDRRCVHKWRKLKSGRSRRLKCSVKVCPFCNTRNKKCMREIRVA